MAGGELGAWEGRRCWTVLQYVRFWHPVPQHGAQAHSAHRQAGRSCVAVPCFICRCSKGAFQEGSEGKESLPTLGPCPRDLDCLTDGARAHLRRAARASPPRRLCQSCRRSARLWRPTRSASARACLHSMRWWRGRRAAASRGCCGSPRSWQVSELTCKSRGVVGEAPGVWLAQHLLVAGPSDSG